MISWVGIQLFFVGASGALTQYMTNRVSSEVLFREVVSSPKNVITCSCGILHPKHGDSIIILTIGICVFGDKKDKNPNLNSATF